jgi:hypothetical protein
MKPEVAASRVTLLMKDEVPDALLLQRGEYRCGFGRCARTRAALPLLMAH